MSEPIEILSETKRSVAARIGWGILIAATLYVSYFSHLGALGFVGPDEPRYAWIARDMVETGDWVTPRLYGKPWFEKPVLYYWGAAVSFKIFGVGEAAARLPSAVSALLATLALAWLAWRLYGDETARWVLLLLPTTVGMIGFSHAASMDMPFSGMLTIAMVAAAEVLRIEIREVEERTVWLALIAFGFFLGAAVLAKGPAAIILCGGAVFFWALFTRRWRDAFRLLHPAAIAAFCATALPWYILCARRNPDFFRVFIIEHNFKRFLTPEFQHIQPLWYYGPVIFIGLFPWVGMSISAVIYLFRKRFGMGINSPSIYLLLWSAFPLLFFSLSKSKLPGYVLPAIPPLILLAADALSRGLRAAKVPRPSGFAILALTPVLAIATVSICLALFLKGNAPRSFVLASGLVAIVGLNACVAFAASERWRALVMTGVLVCAAGVEATDRMWLPWFDPLLSPRTVAVTVRKNGQVEDRVVTFRLKRDWQYGLNFYLNREIPEWNADSPEPAIALASPAGVVELRRRRIPFKIIDNSCIYAFLVQIDKSEETGGATSPGSVSPTP